MSEYIEISQKEYEALIDARDTAEARAREYFNLLCKFNSLTGALAANFDESLLNATPDPRTLPKRPANARN